MSYEPTIIIRKSHLDKAIPKLEKQQYSSDLEEAKAAKYLLEIAESEVIVFDELKLLICEPEGHFSESVRYQLLKLEVEYKTVS